MNDEADILARIVGRVALIAVLCIVCGTTFIIGLAIGAVIWVRWLLT